MISKTEPLRPSNVIIDDEKASEMSGNARWSIDRHIPVATIISLFLFILGQTAVLSYGWASMNSRIDVLERQATLSAPLSERLVRLETKFDGVVDGLTEIKSILRQAPRTQP